MTEKETSDVASTATSSGTSIRVFESISDSVLDFTADDVNAVVPTDDEDVPVLTLRMWVIAFFLGTVITGVDAFFTLRFPTVHIGPIVAQVLAYPLGKLWDMIVPSFQLTIPFTKYGFNLNPSPFNSKEHACVFIVTNIMSPINLVSMTVTEQFKFFKSEIGIGRMIIFNLSSFFISYCLSGLTLSVLVYPVECIWPGILNTCALFKAFHQPEDKHELDKSEDTQIKPTSWKIPPLAYFGWTFLGAFLWYWIPDLIMPFLSRIGAWISWCKPENATLSQIFGVHTGLGLFPLTFDWTQVTSINDPLTTPFWSIATVFASFVIWIWIVLPGLYYSNKWQTANFPIMTNLIYNKDKKPYNASKVVTSDWKLDMEKFEKYSPVVLPISFVMGLALGLGTFSAMMVSFILNFKSEVLDQLGKRHEDHHNLAAAKYKKTHWGFFVGVGVVGFGLGFAFCQGWDDAPIKSLAFFMAILIGSLLYVPLALIESRSNFLLSLSSFFDLVSAFWFKGEPLTLLYFYSFGFNTLQKSMHITMSAKVGHYMKVPPRSISIGIFGAVAWGSLLSPAVVGYALNHIEDVCQPNAKNGMNCRKARTQFNTHLVWGLFGSELFSVHGRYAWVLWFFLAGALAAIVVHIFKCYKPKSAWRYVNATLLFGGATNIPSVTGFNYSTWALVGFIFNFYIHRRHTMWWRKYNLVLSIGLDCGTAIAAIIIYFCVVYTGGSKNFKWWGTTIGKTGCDIRGCPHLNEQILVPSGY
ncbi:oligopeptide transporter 1 [[Candida] anglica]|uniref:Oligopeptide transporter 1 n=1 Tax=[Candida] anglica TaxID=148631 RepID=A0ABP0EB33_9ASCO